MKAEETATIKHAIAILTGDSARPRDRDLGDCTRARDILATLITPAPVKAKATAIEGLTVRLGTWIRRFDADNPKAVKSADATLCKVCAAGLKMARIVPFHLGAKTIGYAHYACAPWIHPTDCICVPCRTRRARANKPLNFTGLTKMLPPQNMEQLLGQKQAVRVSAFAAKAALRKCACGHDGSCHSKDELDNLLQCQMPGCQCDHFHYQTDETAQSAAAGA